MKSLNAPVCCQHIARMSNTSGGIPAKKSWPLVATMTPSDCSEKPLMTGNVVILLKATSRLSGLLILIKLGHVWLHAAGIKLSKYGRNMSQGILKVLQLRITSLLGRTSVRLGVIMKDLSTTSVGVICQAALQQQEVTIACVCSGRFRLLIQRISLSLSWLPGLGQHMARM